MIDNFTLADKKEKQDREEKDREEKDREEKGREGREEKRREEKRREEQRREEKRIEEREEEEIIKVLKKGTGTWEYFEPEFVFHGFQYIQIRGYPGIPALESIQAFFIHSGILYFIFIIYFYFIFLCFFILKFFFL
jgi:Bacterial alpha-L-rhamnosidase concanavalin-like domain